MTTHTDYGAVRDPKPLWFWLRLCLVLYLIATLGVTLSSVGLLALGTESLTGDNLNIGVVLCALGLMVFGLGSVPVFLFTIVTVLRITYRMMKNLHAIHSDQVSISPRMAAGSYFIPFANLVMPVQAVGEIWRGTFGATSGDTDPRGAIGLWWGCWLLSNIVGTVANAIDRQAGAGENLSPAFLVAEAASTALAALACFFMLRVFGKLSKAQGQLAGVSTFE